MAAGREHVSEATLFALQRLTAKLLAPLVIVHLALVSIAGLKRRSIGHSLGRSVGRWRPGGST